MRSAKTAAAEQITRAELIENTYQLSEICRADLRETLTALSREQKAESKHVYFKRFKINDLFLSVASNSVCFDSSLFQFQESRSERAAAESSSQSREQQRVSRENRADQIRAESKNQETRAAQSREIRESSSQRSELKLISSNSSRKRAESREIMSEITKAESSSRSAAKEFIAEQIRAAKYTRNEIISAYLDTFADKKKSTVATYLSDSKNATYTAFDYLAREDKKTKVFSFTKKRVKYNYYRKKK